MAKREYSLSAAEIAHAMRRDCLRAPAADAKRLAAVLGNPEIGDFQLQVLLNKDERELRRRIFDFFDKCHRDDVLLMHVSSHGIKGDRGHLYLAASDTTIDAFGATAVDTTADSPPSKRSCGALWKRQTAAERMAKRPDGPQPLAPKTPPACPLPLQAKGAPRVQPEFITASYGHKPRRSGVL